jgi:[acyl-carrier-protein] S-malonyltransferase
MRAFVFPGQGSQTIGMGRGLYEAFPTAREIFQEVDDVLGQKLSALMFSGEAEQLNLTENTQPALLAVSLALMHVLEKDMKLPFATLTHFTAGHSMGEYSALAASGAFSLAATARLLRLRGLAMQHAVPVGIGGMLALIGASIEQAEEVTLKASQATSFCEVANDNAPGQIVISGHLPALEKAMEIAKEMGIKRALLLPVSAPFHSRLMEPAALKMAEALEKEDLKGMPSVALISNVTATPVTDISQIRPRLVEQMTGRVRWVESMKYLAQQGVTQLVEVGAGKVLAGLMRRIDSTIEVVNIETPEDCEAFHKCAIETIS